MASGGTESFPDLGKNCQHRGCNHLDFLPYVCDGCQRVIHLSLPLFITSAIETFSLTVEKDRICLKNRKLLILLKK